jgi:hypothetical protein
MDLKQVLSDLHAEKAQIEKAIAAFEALNSPPAVAIPVRRGRKPGRPAKSTISGGTSFNPAEFTPAKTRSRRTMSTAARKRISEAAKKRWAQLKAQAVPAKKAPATKKAAPAKTAAKKAAPARIMSAAARKRISLAAKKRWAERRKAAKNA